MKEQLEQRLKELKEEFAKGQKVLADLEAKEATTRNTLIRISGAIQVLEEVLGKQYTTEQPLAEPAESHEIKPANHANKRE